MQLFPVSHISEKDWNAFAGSLHDQPSALIDSQSDLMARSNIN
tara:strand:- start:3309 stop:3437 length:129 start_codon:yes stop_codon:yes gene_type:complete